MQCLYILRIGWEKQDDFPFPPSTPPYLRDFPIKKTKQVVYGGSSIIPHQKIIISEKGIAC